MVMVSENQSGNLNGVPLQSLQFPTMMATENIVKKKLKIKIVSRRIEAEPGRESCELGQRVFQNDECGHGIRVSENKNSEMNKSHKLVITSSSHTNDSKSKPSVLGFHKRGLPEVGDGQKEKRRKIDRSVTHQCFGILKQLMTHRYGWVFNHPVDPVKLNIPDYFSVISDPMDLGTIKTKLENNSYSSVEEFAADVRLTFSNAMVYNPPSNNVHGMAKELNKIFNTRWKCFEAKWTREHTDVEQRHSSSERAKNTNSPEQTDHRTSSVHVSLLPKRLMPAEVKQKLKKQLLEVSREKMSPHLQGFLKKIGFKQRDGRIDMDIDAFDDETLWELKRNIGLHLGATAVKAESAMKTETTGQQSLGKIIHKDLSSERSLGQDHFNASRKVCEAKSLSASQMSKSDPDSDGALSALDEEQFCSSPQLSTVATTATSEEGLSPLIDIQLSPKKALRAAMLKSRFADTILKAKRKTLLDHVDKADVVKMQQEKERLEIQQRKERARIEAQIQAAEAASRIRAEAEMKTQREREREAARLALQKMEKTVEIDNNLESLKDLEMLSRCSLSDNLHGFRIGNLLEELGLVMKDDFMGDEEDEVAILNGDGEEGEIFS
ncbi:transcription factor GTE12-like isoform X2 [Camellia sinensis]|uniref:transcription factor GTE12-like isoform X2 n=1 Tax=Camellia sinensis TaxID=4442 RepID=UPI001036F133|nr:transcription factor GTE12-like isoform X2 [Camellia sinensis]